jgi:PleD family two-component response regulator
MEKLAQDNIIDTGVASRFFYSLQDYYDTLTEYITHYDSYIHHYNPIVVVASDAEKNIFFAACSKTRAMLTQLGLTASLSGLDMMENAARAGDIKELSDRLVMFHGMLEIAANHILAAQKEPGSEPVKRKLMLVHDDDKMVNKLNAMLDDAYNVISFTSGSIAVRALESHLPEVFLLLIEMKDICGYELALYIREHDRFKHTPILFLEGEATCRKRHNIMPLLEARYIRLPTERETLHQKIEGVMK